MQCTQVLFGVGGMIVVTICPGGISCFEIIRASCALRPRIPEWLHITRPFVFLLSRRELDCCIFTRKYNCSIGPRADRAQPPTKGHFRHREGLSRARADHHQVPDCFAVPQVQVGIEVRILEHGCAGILHDPDAAKLAEELME
jgi:hypothetical protein